jgi:hypothetical protein
VRRAPIAETGRVEQRQEPGGGQLRIAGADGQRHTALVARTRDDLGVMHLVIGEADDRRQRDIDAAGGDGIGERS